MILVAFQDGADCDAPRPVAHCTMCGWRMAGGPVHSGVMRLSDLAAMVDYWAVHDCDAYRQKGREAAERLIFQLPHDIPRPPA